MRRHSDRNVFLLAIGLSLAMSALTVWSVAWQGQALHDREWSDLVAKADAAARERRHRLQTDADAALDTLFRRYHTTSLDGVDTWLTGQDLWQLAAVTHSTSSPQILPRTPLSDWPALSPGSDPDEAARSDDLVATLNELRDLMDSRDPLIRAGAMLSAAGCEQRLGRPFAAVRLSTDAAELLRTTPNLDRLAFRAELLRIEALWAAGERAQARSAYAELLRAARQDHPARLGPEEVQRLERMATRLITESQGDLFAALSELAQQAARRAHFAALLTTHLTTTADESTEPLALVSNENDSAVIAARSAGDITLALLATPTALRNAYWYDPPTSTPWAVHAPPPQDLPELARLDPRFGNAALVPAAHVRTRLEALRNRQLGYVLATATGTIGAWGLVFWMLSRAIRRQRELVRIQRRLVADVSHELKTPLALIRLAAETLSERRVRDPERIQSYHETIIRESERLSVLLDSILDFSRMESGRKAYDFGTCDVGRIARQAWALFEPQFAQESFDAQVEIADDVPAVHADALALQQVLVNLLQNAYRYSGEAKYVRLRVWRDGYLLVMAVEDHGIGMSRNQLEHIGDSFVRGDDSIVRQTRGAGLGLAIVNHVVTAHRGKIEVQSAPGKGSTFTIWLPIEMSPDENTATARSGD